MRSWHRPILALWLALGATQTTVAQIEKRAETYDLTLEDCLTWTFRRYPDIQRLRTEIEGAMGTRVVYRSRALPQLAAQFNGGLRGGPLYPPSGPFGILTAQFSQPLLDVGIPPTLRRGRLEVVLAQQNLNREVTDRLHEARVTFLRALYYRDLIALHEVIDKRLQKNAESEQQRLDVGTGNEAAVKSARIQKLNLELALSNLHGWYFSSVTRLAELCGRDPGTGVNDARQLWLPKPVGVLPYEPVTVDLPQESAYALQHRADLKLLQALVDATAADRQTVQAGYFPSVSLVSTALLIPQSLLVHKETALVVGQDTRSSEVRAGAELSWRVIDNGQVTGASHRLEAVRQAYEITLHQLQQNIPRELAVIQGELQNADTRREALNKSAAEAEENLELIEAQVALGQATQLDFLKAQSNLLSVRVGIAEATYSHAIACAELDHALGRYLQYYTEDPQ
jgi:outer membrane protein TolC